MKKIKLFFGLIILIFAGLVVYQNRDYFFAKQALSLSLGVETWHWTALPVQNLAYFGIALALGLLGAGFYGIASKLKSKKTIKSLNATIESHLEKIASLKAELEPFTSDPYQRKAVTENQEPGDDQPIEKEETA
ncbi:MAG: hypothetical protein JEZ12_19000 [Desulfobacterium sp.]|nr:hypothetical protein [Desulfobacterium sp.]